MKKDQYVHVIIIDTIIKMKKIKIDFIWRRLRLVTYVLSLVCGNSRPLAPEHIYLYSNINKNGKYSGG